MAKSVRLTKMFTRLARMSLNKGISSENPELAAFFTHSVDVGVESSIIEFAARVCYSSTAKLGSAPNFVTNVLKSGHLSVAEHPVVGVHSTEFGIRYERNKGQSKYVFMRENRYFDFNGGYILGNMRSWIEYAATAKNDKGLEQLIAILPEAFHVTPIEPRHAIEIDSFRNFVNVPSFYNGNGMAVHLLAANVDVPLKNQTYAIEYGRFTFLVEGVSRSLTHQLARHRGASISQESQRYVDATKHPSFVYPRYYTEAQKQVLAESYIRSLEEYETLRKSGMKKEDARFLLPNGIATRLVVSFSITELLHFLRVRCAKDAQWEIREMAHAMLDQVVMCKPTKEVMELKQWTELQKQD